MVQVCKFQAGKVEELVQVKGMKQGEDSKFKH